MAILDNTKLDALFKGFFSKARTSSNKQFFEENIPTAYDVHAQDVYVDEIPSVPPTEDTLVLKKYAKLILTKDKSVEKNLAWVALPTWTADWSSGSATDIATIHKNFISPKYGSGYVVKVFKGDGKRIPELDATDWMFDYKAGVLTFQGDPGMDGSTEEKSIYIEVYQYIGKMVTDLNDDAKTSDLYVKTTTISQIIEAERGETGDNVVTFADFEYTLGNNDLMVFLNGMLMFKDEDYQETTTTSITFLTNLEIDDKIVLRKQEIAAKE